MLPSLQGLYPDDPSTMQLPFVTIEEAEQLPVLAQLLEDTRQDRGGTMQRLGDLLGVQAASEATRVLERLPIIEVTWGEPKLVDSQPEASISKPSN